ncbi:orotidine-5'-phosphate decarboxylase [Phytohabitans houttuyneae]|uniref:Orotidine-5'-phosphate decarboxylase n=1 Tax=Phytohabitans houttuyneae TaxID=1076126 RepID=A0A6V8KFC3_9ACTN|nr:orotidine-5'-phosphate decarboxylase [Phytohabitans houttuyneae]GFJ81058.1 orotidine 5'-phosphate decarboxylase [Phytohabitans houttuyneae]
MKHTFATWHELAAERTGLAVGVAPSPKWLSAWGLPDTVGGAGTFCDIVLASLAGVAAVKVQTPFFERFGAEGLALLSSFFAGCAQRGTLTVADAKRCDTEDTMASYADLYLGEQSVLGADAVTVAPYIGVDATAPLFEVARQRGCAVFVLVRTSNHESAVQLSRDEGGRTVSEQVADRIAAHNRTLATGGRAGPVAAVVGAPPEAAAALLRRMPDTVVSLPGLGRPGRTVDQFRTVVGDEGGRVVLPISSGVLEAGPHGLADRIRQWQTVLRPMCPPGRSR